MYRCLGFHGNVIHPLRITIRSFGGFGITGKHSEFGDDERRPADQLLRWHFRQAMLTNMKGAGEPVFEFDFLPGTDMMSEMSGSLSSGRVVN